MYRIFLPISCFFPINDIHMFILVIHIMFSDITIVTPALYIYDLCVKVFLFIFFSTPKTFTFGGGRGPFFIIHLFTRAYIVWVTSPSCSHPHLLPPSPIPSRQNLCHFKVSVLIGLKWDIKCFMF
jgi:hypothetical protein